MLKNTARVTGIWYLLLAITGMVGFLFIRPQLFEVDNPQQSYQNVLSNLQIAHIGVGVELAIVATQSFASLWFFKLFIDIHRMAAYGVLVFGMMNSVVILFSAIVMSALVQVAGNAQLAPHGDMVGTISLLLTLSTTAWSVGGLFFGLWLIPMGMVALQTKRYPKTLGWVLLLGAFGYLLSAFLGQVWIDAPKMALDLLIIPATIGEFWMVGYLLSKGIRPNSDAATAG